MEEGDLLGHGVFQVEEDGGLDKGGYSGPGEKWSDSGHILIY